MMSRTAAPTVRGEIPQTFGRAFAQPQAAQMLQSAELEFLMEAHNGCPRASCGGRLQGHLGLGLSISAQFGVRDNNEASWTQVVDMLEFMADASDLPILLDGDTGYGNFNNMRRLVRKLEQRGIAGVCIEDKQFPKTNSFLERRAPAAGRHRGVRRQDRRGQGHADGSEFLHRGAGRGVDRRLGHGRGAAPRGGLPLGGRGCHPDPQQAVQARRDRDLRARMGAPLAAGDRADQVLQHADRRVPQAGISTVIWANHLVRSAASAMQSVAKEIFDSQTLVNVEDRIVLGERDFPAAGCRRILGGRKRVSVGVGTSRSPWCWRPAAAAGSRRSPTDRPKVMLPIAGKPLLRWLVDGFKKESINDITVVGGYRADAIDTAGIKLV
jgi:phosphoenolpyruvate phosphomutase